MRHPYLLPWFTVALAALLIAGAALADPVRRYRTDSDDLASMKREHPKAAELFEQAEGLMAAGQIDKAVDLLQQVTTDDPQSSLAARRQCQALTALERHDEAVASCKKAVANQGIAPDFRAEVGALMSGEKPPTPVEMSTALLLARTANEMMSDEPWGFAASCDIAARLGDTEMFNQCLDDLQRVNPTRYETARAAAIAARFRVRWWVAAGWAVLAALAAATGWHAMWRSRKKWAYRKRTLGVGAAALLIGGSLAGSSVPAHAEEAETSQREVHAGALSKWPINEKDPASSVPTNEQRDSDPLEFGYLLMDLGDRAIAATGRGDHAAAAKYYGALAKAVPDRSIAFSRMCESYEKAGEWEKAAISCATALTREGVTLADFTHYAKVLLDKKGPLEQQEIDDVDAVITHLKGQEGAQQRAAEIQCGLGAVLADRTRLEECTPALVAAAPNDPGTLYFQWSLEMVKRDYPGAKAIVDRAKSTSMGPDQIQRMSDAIIDAQPIWRRGFRDWRLVATVPILIFAGLAMFLAKRTLRESQA